MSEHRPISISKKVLVVAFLIFMTFFFFQMFSFNITLIQTKEIREAYALLSDQRLWIVRLIKVLMENAFEFGTILRQTLNIVSVPVIVLLLIWYRAFYKTKMWRPFVFAQIIYGVLNVVLVSGLGYALQSNSIATGFTVMHAIAWVTACIAAVLTLIGIVSAVLVVGDYIAVD